MTRSKIMCLVWVLLAWSGLIACQVTGDEYAVASLPTLITTRQPTEATTTPTLTSVPPPVLPVLPTPTPSLVSTVTIVLPTNAPNAAAINPTQMIPGLIGPSDYPADVNPLTGETVNNPAVLARRPLAIKISNYPPLVRPQAGLNNADLIFEHYAEGGVTRFTAIFYSQDADPVGSIRSGRLIDLEIPKMYDAALAYSGSSGPVQEMIRTASFFDRVISPDFGHSGFYRIENATIALEHTLFTDTPTLHYLLGLRGQDTPPQLPQGMAFLATIPPGGTDHINRIELQYRGTNVFWQYNGGSSRYTRWTDGQPHLDANTGQQLNFRNIVVLGAHHEDTEILEDLVDGGHYSIQIQIWGEGPVSIFRDGQRFEGIWRRANESDMLTFYDVAGNILPLAPGNTFFQIVPLGFEHLTVSP
ncbi:MAG: DUF3048 domain-containing protein [Chloroflexi bacterium]|nr:DUF3048 domain-containing protein [Chloroflexota bacterium]MBP8054858.1 DUF3048 domain-containing protein [Chloroflexota bacterium]